MVRQIQRRQQKHNLFPRFSWGGYDSSNWAKADTAGIFTNFMNSTVQNNDTVYIASGHYKITSSINLIKSIKLYGGFSGNEKSIDDRDFTKNETIIDAQKETGRRVFEIYTNSVIDGFTITGRKDDDIYSAENFSSKIREGYNKRNSQQSF